MAPFGITAKLRGARAGLAAPWRWVIQAFGAADEGIAAFKEAQKLVGGAGDADAHAFADGARGTVDFAKPEFFVFAEVHAVVAAIDLQRLREAARPAREIEEFSGIAVALHDFD